VPRARAGCAIGNHLSEFKSFGKVRVVRLPRDIYYISKYNRILSEERGNFHFGALTGWEEVGLESRRRGKKELATEMVL
jgi:hypothetical protein